MNEFSARKNEAAETAQQAFRYVVLRMSDLAVQAGRTLVFDDGWKAEPTSSEDPTLRLRPPSYGSSCSLLPADGSTYQPLRVEFAAEEAAGSRYSFRASYTGRYKVKLRGAYGEGLLANQRVENVDADALFAKLLNATVAAEQAKVNRLQRENAQAVRRLQMVDSLATLKDSLADLGVKEAWNGLSFPGGSVERGDNALALHVVGNDVELLRRLVVTAVRYHNEKADVSQLADAAAEKGVL